MKKPMMFMVAAMLSLAAYSQTVPDKVDKQIKDPKRVENAGKADVILMDKKQIFDSTTFKTPAAATNSTVKSHAKKKGCVKKKTKRSV